MRRVLCLMVWKIANAAERKTLLRHNNRTVSPNITKFARILEFGRHVRIRVGNTDQKGAIGVAQAVSRYPSILGPRRPCTKVAQRTCGVKSANRHE